MNYLYLLLYTTLHCDDINKQHWLNFVGNTYILTIYDNIKISNKCDGNYTTECLICLAPSFISFVHMHEKAPAFVSGMMGQQVIILVTFRSFSARRLRNCLVNSVSLGCQNMSFCPILRPAKYFY